MNDIQLQSKEGKIYSPIRKKWLVENPEERVRQEYVLELVNSYQYSVDQMDEELQMSGRGSGGGRADIAIWKSEEAKSKKETPFIIVECKADNVRITEEDYMQGKYYARTYDCPFFVTHNNHETKYWRIIKEKVPGHREEIENIPKAGTKAKEVEKLLKKLKSPLLHLKNKEILLRNIAFCVSNTIKKRFIRRYPCTFIHLLYSRGSNDGFVGKINFEQGRIRLAQHVQKTPSQSHTSDGKLFFCWKIFEFKLFYQLSVKT